MYLFITLVFCAISLWITFQPYCYSHKRFVATLVCAFGMLFFSLLSIAQDEVAHEEKTKAACGSVGGTLQQVGHNTEMCLDRNRAVVPYQEAK